MINGSGYEDGSGELLRYIGDIFTPYQILYDRRKPGVVHLYGRLTVPPESAYDALKERLSVFGYTPMLREDRGWHVLTLVPGVLVEPKPRSPLVNIVLAILTFFTTTMIGKTFSTSSAPIWSLKDFTAGMPFSVSLMTILGIHELGHYFMGRKHKVSVTLPYFIPVPFGLGTFGAFIQMRSPVRNRRHLFDVGVAGPLAGAAVAIPLYIIGFSLSATEELSQGHPWMGSSLLVKFVDLFRRVPHGYYVKPNPVASAAWFGLFVTALNLLPIGQLDGGHVAYALFGSVWGNRLAKATLVLLAVGSILWTGWMVWGFLALILGVTHPPLLDEITTLDEKRRWVGYLAIFLFLITVPPKPFYF